MNKIPETLTLQHVIKFLESDAAPAEFDVVDSYRWLTAQCLLQLAGVDTTELLASSGSVRDLNMPVTVVSYWQYSDYYQEVDKIRCVVFDKGLEKMQCIIGDKSEVEYDAGRTCILSREYLLETAKEAANEQNTQNTQNTDAPARH